MKTWQLCNIRQLTGFRTGSKGDIYGTWKTGNGRCRTRSFGDNEYCMKALDGGEREERTMNKNEVFNYEERSLKIVRSDPEI